jgi:16S rRNA (guanine527-N7)-methyltransferase
VTGRLSDEVVHRVEALADRYALPTGAAAGLGCLLTALVDDPLAPTSVRDPVRAVEDHLADSLVALELPAVRRAARGVDIGAGAGLPGLPLAVALPDTPFVLLESAARKCTFLAGVIEQCGLRNAAVVHARAEEWSAGLAAFDLATARAVAPPAVLLEYAAPLLSIGGVLVAWRGRRDPEAEVAAEAAADELGMEASGVLPVTPYPSAAHRHVHLWSKVRDTPNRFPRRPGMALKRPLGGRRPPSDRMRR